MRFRGWVSKAFQGTPNLLDAGAESLYFEEVGPAYGPVDPET